MNKTSFSIVKTTVNLLARTYLTNFIRSFLIPIDYTRTKEIPAVLDLSGILERKDEHLKILDIGSPQLLSLSLGQYSRLWDITYVNPFVAELQDMREKSSILGLDRIHSVNADITLIDSFSGLGTFDYIFSCSVFEHIHPEDGGDIIAALNISQLLETNGTFVFSVPYYLNKFNEYIEGTAYAVEGDYSGKTFFQRFYDEDSLQKQIVIPTGLKVVCRTYIGEKFYSVNNIKKRMAFLIGYGKPAMILGRLFNKISNVFMEETDDFRKLKKPYLAIYSLVKD